MASKKVWTNVLSSIPYQSNKMALILDIIEYEMEDSKIDVNELRSQLWFCYSQAISELLYRDQSEKINKIYKKQVHGEEEKTSQLAILEHIIRDLDEKGNLPIGTHARIQKYVESCFAGFLSKLPKIEQLKLYNITRDRIQQHKRGILSEPEFIDKLKKILR